MLIGRSRRCDTTIRSPLVSRRHCRLEKRGQGFFLRDLGSQNGTWLEGERVDHAYLQTGDRFVAGDVILRVRSDGTVDEEGTSNPRTVLSGPRIADHLPALLILLVPLVGAVVLAVLVGRGTGREDGSRVRAEETATTARRGAEAPGERAERADGGTPPSATRRTSPADRSGEAGGAASVSTPDLAGETAPREDRDPTARDPMPGGDPDSGATDPLDGPAPTLEELLAIAAACDRALAEREEEMAELLGDDASGAEVVAKRPEPPPLEEAWAAIERTGGPVPAAGETAARPRNAGGVADPDPRYGPAPPPEGVARAGTIAPPPTGERGSLFDDSARADLAAALVEQGEALIDRYHVPAVSHEPLLPVIARLRDIGGIPAIDGLLALRVHAEDHLARVYRRVQELERRARRADRDLGRTPKGGADEREDELTMRLAAMVKEHLETLVAIRADLESTILADAEPVFLVRSIEWTIDQRDVRFFEGAAKMAALYDRKVVIPALIAALDARVARMRASARDILEEWTGERPGTSSRAWREWWDAKMGAND